MTKIKHLRFGFGKRDRLSHFFKSGRIFDFYPFYKLCVPFICPLGEADLFLLNN